MGSAEHGEMQQVHANAPEATVVTEKPEASEEKFEEKKEFPLPQLTPLQPLEPLKDVMQKASDDAAAQEAAYVEAKDVAAASSKHGDGEGEIKSPPGMSVDQAMELQNAAELSAAKRRKLTAEEVSDIGIPDSDLIVQLI
eukprot:s6213_g1.t1